MVSENLVAGWREVKWRCNYPGRRGTTAGTQK
jgi:hypothetical protein